MARRIYRVVSWGFVILTLISIFYPRLYGEG